MTEDDRHIKYINVGMEFTNKVSKKILENLDGDERAEQLGVMRRIMKDYIKMEHQHNISKTVLEKIRRGLDLESANMDRDIEADYQNLLQAELEKEGIDEDRLAADPRYRQLESLISGDVQASSLENQDVVVTQDNQIFTDPWTRKPINKEPLTNKVCGHTYEKSTVMMVLGRSAKSKKPVKCPFVGCSVDNIR